MENKSLKAEAEYYLNCTYNNSRIKRINQRRVEQLGRYIDRGKMILWVKDENEKRNPPDRENFVKITSPLNEFFEWHHIDKIHVVAIPTKLHRNVNHTLSNKESMNRINNIVNEWYKIKYGRSFILL